MLNDRKRTAPEMEAERTHLARLNKIHTEEGDTDRAARLLIILATRSYQTKGWDWPAVAHDVRVLAVNKYRGPGWLIGIGKQ